jgi:two-component system, cell cycle response regulator DivK
VLIVEDNKRSLKLARDLLQYQGFRTLEAEDAETRLRLAKDSLPNIILIDSELPGMDGVRRWNICGPIPRPPASRW